MLPNGTRFRPPWWGVLLAALGCAGGLALGQWQSGRAEAKRAAASAPRLELRGEFMAKHTVLLGNRLYRSRPGYEVIQPFRIAGAGLVLVNRGWIAAGPDRDRLPEIRTPAGEIRIAGVRRERFARVYEPAGAKPEGRVWPNMTPERFAAWSGLRVEPWVLEQHGSLDDGLARDWPAPEAGADKHDAYALQWYSLAGLSVVFLLVLGFRREKTSS
jgi:surfeit locus 1 family protein